jgi:hypothetical protein
LSCSQRYFPVYNNLKVDTNHPADTKSGDWHKDLFAEKTEVFFSNLSAEGIDAYVQTGTPMYVLLSHFPLMCATDSLLGIKLEVMEFKRKLGHLLFPILMVVFGM